MKCNLLKIMKTTGLDYVHVSCLSGISTTTLRKIVAGDPPSMKTAMLLADSMRVAMVDIWPEIAGVPPAGESS